MCMKLKPSQQLLWESTCVAACNNTHSLTLWLCMSSQVMLCLSWGRRPSPPHAFLILVYYGHIHNTFSGKWVWWLGIVEQQGSFEPVNYIRLQPSNSKGNSQNSFESFPAMTFSSMLRRASTRECHEGLRSNRFCHSCSISILQWATSWLLLAISSSLCVGRSSCIPSKYHRPTLSRHCISFLIVSGKRSPVEGILSFITEVLLFHSILCLLYLRQGQKSNHSLLRVHSCCRVHYAFLTLILQTWHRYCVKRWSYHSIMFWIQYYN